MKITTRAEAEEMIVQAEATVTGQRLVPAQLGDHTVRAASTPVRDGKGTPLHFEKIHLRAQKTKSF